jgi:hypothetical protein
MSSRSHHTDRARRRAPKEHPQIVPAFYDVKSSLCDCCNDVTVHIHLIDRRNGDLYSLAIPEEYVEGFANRILEQKKGLPQLMVDGAARGEYEWVAMFEEEA